MAKQIEGVSERILACAKEEFLEKGFSQASAVLQRRAYLFAIITQNAQVWKIHLSIYSGEGSLKK